MGLSISNTIDMIGKIFQLFGKTAKTIRDKVDDGVDFIDDTLEAEYITGSIRKAKDLSGKVVQKAGETYEKGKMLAEDIVGDERIDQLKQKTSDLIASGKQGINQALEQPQIKQATDKLKQLGQDVVDGAEKLTDSAEDFIIGKMGLDEEE